MSFKRENAVEEKDLLRSKKARWSGAYESE